MSLVESVAAGDVTVQIDSHGQDEVSKLLTALGRMSAGLSRIVSQVRYSSATGGSQIATGNSDLS